MSMEDTRSLNAKETESISSKVAANCDKDDILTTSNDDILLQPFDSSRSGIALLHCFLAHIVH